MRLVGLLFQGCLILSWPIRCAGLRTPSEAEPLQRLVYGAENRSCPNRLQLTRCCRSCRTSRAATRCRRSGRSKPVIVGGDLVRSREEFPFLAWIGDDDLTPVGLHFCGGAAISERLVLTAAHCLYDGAREPLNSQIRVRLQLLDFGKEVGVARRVINWKRHEAFNGEHMFNDVGLLLLDKPLPKKAIVPVKLSNGTQDYERSGNLTVAGWGSTDEWCQDFDTLLRSSAVPAGNSGPDCSVPGSRELKSSQDFDVERQLCAGLFGQAGLRHAGCGDSGGPLLARDGGGWVQVGVLSWRYKQGFPDVYTRVSAYGGWIESAGAALLAQGRNEMA